MEEYDDEQKARLLQFVTGSSRVPIQGFKALQGKKQLSIPTFLQVVISVFFFFMAYSAMQV